MALTPGANPQAGSGQAIPGATTLNLNDLDEVVVELVEAARMAQQNARAISAGKKTVAQVAQQYTISGWSSRRGYIQKTNEVMQRAAETQGRPPVGVGYAAVDALYTAVADEEFDPSAIDYNLTDEDVDPYELAFGANKEASL